MICIQLKGVLGFSSSSTDLISRFSFSVQQLTTHPQIWYGIYTETQVSKVIYVRPLLYGIISCKGKHQQMGLCFCIIFFKCECLARAEEDRNHHTLTLSRLCFSLHHCTQKTQKRNSFFCVSIPLLPPKHSPHQCHWERACQKKV